MAAEFRVRTERYYSELKYIYSELYGRETEEFDELLKILQEEHRMRPAPQKRRDRDALSDPTWYRSAAGQDRLIRGREKVAVMTLPADFEDPKSLNRFVKELLSYANAGVQLIALEGIGKLFRIPETGWQNRTRVHIVLRILRIAVETVCPAVVLYGHIKGYTKDYTEYFGTPEKPELHLINDAQTAPTVWQTVATHDTRLLTHYVNELAYQPENRVFLRTRDEGEGVFWNLDYPYLAVLQMNEESHRKFLQRYFTGTYKDSESSAHRIKDRDSGTWGVYGSLAEFTGGDARIAALVNAFTLQLSGVPMPAETKERAALLKARKACPAFDCASDLWTPGIDNDKTIGIGQYKDGRKVYGLYNFSAEEQVFTLHDPGRYTNLVSGKEVEVVNLVRLQPYGFAWLLAE